MSLSTANDRGFGIVEVIIAMLLLGIIAVALVPALWQGMVLSSKQSSVASATRLLNARIEEARAEKSCDTIFALDDVPADPPTAGDGSILTVSFDGVAPQCPTQDKTVSFTLQVSDPGNTVLARATAIVYVP